MVSDGAFVTFGHFYRFMFVPLTRLSRRSRAKLWMWLLSSSGQTSGEADPSLDSFTFLPVQDDVSQLSASV